MKTEVIRIHPDFPDIKEIGRCARIIRKGGLVIFPTETVYGIAADLSNPKAMERLKKIKHRGEDKPFSVLISQVGLISNYTSMTDPLLYKMISAYWPGPLTVVVPSREEGKTIGVRMPDHAIALRLVQESQCTIAAPSANITGKEPPKTCEEALSDFDGLVEAAIDGGESKYGLGSSVVDLTKGKPLVLRDGVINQSDVDKIAGKTIILFVCTGNSCRSVMAEYLLKKLVQGRRDVEVHSAGTSVFIQSMASRETISVLSDEGINAAGHISQPISTILLKKADLIFVMTGQHRMQVLDRVPQVEKRVYLLREFAKITASSQAELDIPDPIGKSHEAYKECKEIIKDSVGKIVNLLPKI